MGQRAAAAAAAGVCGHGVGCQGCCLEGRVGVKGEAALGGWRRACCLPARGSWCVMWFPCCLPPCARAPLHVYACREHWQQQQLAWCRHNTVFRWASNILTDMKMERTTLLENGMAYARISRARACAAYVRILIVACVRERAQRMCEF